MQPLSQTYPSDHDPNWDPVLRDQKVFPDVPSRLLLQMFFHVSNLPKYLSHLPHEVPAELLIKPLAEISFELALETLVEVAVIRSNTKLPC